MAQGGDSAAALVRCVELHASTRLLLPPQLHTHRPPHTGLPLMNKKVYQREQEVAALRDAKYSDVGEFKDDMRGQRMSIKRGQGLQ